MAITMKHVSLTVSTFGVIAFVLGIIAENKKPASGIAITENGLLTCKYPSDPTVALGFLSVAALVASTVTGLYSIFYPYEGKAVPHSALFRSTTLVVFFLIAAMVSLFAQGMMLWATITEHLHLTHNVHKNLDAGCPTAKTGLFGGAAFLALNSSLFWLICLMLADNAREDYFDDEENRKGEYGQVYATDFDDAKGQGKV